MSFIVKRGNREPVNKKLLTKVKPSEIHKGIEYYIIDNDTKRKYKAEFVDIIEDMNAFRFAETREGGDDDIDIPVGFTSDTPIQDENVENAIFEPKYDVFIPQTKKILLKSGINDIAKELNSEISKYLGSNSNSKLDPLVKKYFDTFHQTGGKYKKKRRKTKRRKTKRRKTKRRKTKRKTINTRKTRKTRK
jgi:hypothetical protein